MKKLFYVLLILAALPAQADHAQGTLTVTVTVQPSVQLNSLPNGCTDIYANCDVTIETQDGLVSCAAMNHCQVCEPVLSFAIN